MTEGNQNSRIRSLVQHGSTHVVAGALFALPGFLMVSASPLGQAEQGYYLIATAFMIAYLALRNLGENTEDEDMELSEFNRTQKAIYVTVLLSAALVAVSARVALGMFGAMLTAGFLSQSLTVVLISGLIPVMDYKLAERDHRLSIPSLLGICAAKLTSMAFIRWYSDDSMFESALEDPRRFAPM